MAWRTQTKWMNLKIQSYNRQKIIHLLTSNLCFKFVDFKLSIFCFTIVVKFLSFWIKLIDISTNRRKNWSISSKNALIFNISENFRITWRIFFSGNDSDRNNFNFQQAHSYASTHESILINRFFKIICAAGGCRDIKEEFPHVLPPSTKNQKFCQKIAFFRPGVAEISLGPALCQEGLIF